MSEKKAKLSYVKDGAIASKTYEHEVDENGMAVLTDNIARIASEDNNEKFQNDLGNSMFVVTKSGKSNGVGVAYNGVTPFESLGSFKLFEGFDTVKNRYELKLQAKAKQIDLITVECKAGTSKTKVSKIQEQALALVPAAERKAVEHYLSLLQVAKKAVKAEKKEATSVTDEAPEMELDVLPSDL